MNRRAAVWKPSGLFGAPVGVFLLIARTFTSVYGRVDAPGCGGNRTVRGGELIDAVG